METSENSIIDIVSFDDFLLFLQPFIPRAKKIQNIKNNIYLCKIIQIIINGVILFQYLKNRILATFKTRVNRLKFNFMEFAKKQFMRTREVFVQIKAKIRQNFLYRFVRCAMCDVRCAMCDVRCAMCDVRCAMCAILRSNLQKARKQKSFIIYRGRQVIVVCPARRILPRIC